MGVYLQLPAAAADGPGAWVDVSAMGATKIISVSGGDLVGTINIEISNEAVASAASTIASINNAGVARWTGAAQWMRANVTGYRSGAAPDVRVGADDGVVQRTSLAATAGDGSGAAVDTQAMGALRTITVTGAFRGTVQVEFSQDNVHWAAGFLAFTSPGQTTAVVPAKYMRCTRSGVPMVAPGLPVVNVAALDEGGGTASSTPDWVNVQDYGAVGDGVVDDTAAILAAAAVAEAEVRPLYFPRSSGTYQMSQPLVIDWSYAAVYGDPGSKIAFTGAGICIDIDGGAVAGALIDVQIRDLIIAGNALSTTGLHLRAVFHGAFSDIRVIDVANEAYRFEFVGSNRFANLVISSNEGPLAVKPTYGIWMGRRNALENSTANLFLNPIIEGLNQAGGIGIHMEYADVNTFISALSQGNDTGIELTNTCGQNLFISPWLEANVTNDIVDNSFWTTVINIKSQTLLHVGADAYDNEYYRGSAENVQIDENVGVTDQGIVLNRIAVGGSLGTGTFVDNGRLTKRKVWSWGTGTFAGSREFPWAPNLAAGAFLSTTEVGMTYVVVGDRVQVAPITAALPDGVEVYATVIADGQVRITAVNHDVAGHNLVGFEWRLDMP